MSIALTNRASLRGALPWVVLGLGVALSVGNLALYNTQVRPRALAASESGVKPTAGHGDPESSASTAPPTRVSLTGAEIKVAEIQCEPARLVTLPTELGAPGRIEANANRELLIRPRAAGVVREVRVKLGQAVKKSDTLIVLDSADVGTARLDLRARQRELATARVEADWKKRVAANVATLIPELRKRVEAKVIAKQFADRPLGSFRGTLLKAYSLFDITSHEEEKTLGLHQDAILGEHPAYIATHTREGSQAEFEGVLEQSRFDANLQSMRAEQMMRQAEAAVVDAAQRLRILGVPEDVDSLLADAGAVAASRQSTGEDVTAYPVLAPFDGTIIARTPTAVISQKAEVNDVLFTLADLSTVWVMVNVPEADFGLLPALEPGATIQLAAPAAYPGRSFEAKVLMVGASVDPATRTVPVLAESDNRDGLLKVGMFVRITLDTTVESQALTVPAAAVVDIEGRPGVFLPDSKGERAFTFRPVQFGREAGDRRVVTTGLIPGDVVVAKGAFLLKSELILQNQEDED